MLMATMIVIMTAIKCVWRATGIPPLIVQSVSLPQDAVRKA